MCALQFGYHGDLTLYGFLYVDETFAYVIQQAIESVASGDVKSQIKHNGDYKYENLAVACFYANLLFSCVLFLAMWAEVSSKSVYDFSLLNWLAIFLFLSSPITY